jgi:hypothetical protein
MAVRQPLLTRAREEDAKVASEADLALLRSSSTKARSAAVIIGLERPLRAVMCSWHHGIQFLQAVEQVRRIFELSAASRAVVYPSGVVPVSPAVAVTAVHPRAQVAKQKDLIAFQFIFS